MAQKKRLGKDPFASTPPTSEPQASTPPAKTSEVKVTASKKSSSTAKKSTSPKIKKPSPAPIAPQDEKTIAVVQPEASDNATEIENIRKELAEIHAIVLRLQQQQLDFMKQWNETLLSPWQWWLSLFS